ncbi:hypothetical protein KGQ27_01495 [Patescibacteria group bacterium]|nr:hypothetical protein [Patescibacteria group bacterium]MDE1946484.1 hypothetical protein [Patescibacteria group bacterium]MDE2011164.1 hypothetical protein [Patescibacteria group bacterium]MDE2233546.1 hypothetical protein [Patescibacteria group bacterium]
MKNKSIISAVSIAATASFVFVSSAFAQVGANAAGGAAVGWHDATITANASTTRRALNQEQRQAALTRRIQNGQNNGGKEIQNRIDALNKLLVRIQSMKNLSDSEKASLAATIQTDITSMTNLEAKIQSDNSTTSLRADLQTIAPDYRIYMLIMPQVSILSAADRVNTLVNSLQIIQGKIQSRVSADAGLSGNTTIAANLSDMLARLSDASTQAAAAQTEVAALTPDQGNTTITQSNTSALKDARSKIQAAIKDLQAVRKDVQTIIKLIIQSDKNLGASAPASTTAQ